MRRGRESDNNFHRQKNQSVKFEVCPLMKTELRENLWKLRSSVLAWIGRLIMSIGRSLGRGVGWGGEQKESMGAH